MLHALFNGPDHGAQIYGAQIIPDSPDRSAFNRGGSEIGNKNCTHLEGPETSAEIKGPDLILDPPVRSAFNGRRGGPE